MMRIFFFAAVLLMLNACGNKDKIPNDVLPPEKMQAVLWDVIKAEAFTAEYIKKDSLKNAGAENLKLQQQVFGIHKISKAVFYKSFDYYKSNPVVFKTIMDTLVNRAQRNQYQKQPPPQPTKILAQ